MHRSLLIPDIQALIFEHLATCKDDTQKSLLNRDMPSFKALAALARTCRDLSDPALDKIWRRATLALLIKVMPGDLWQQAQIMSMTVCELLGPGKHSVVTVFRSLEDSDWKRFDYYAQKIRILATSHPFVPSLHVHPNVLYALAVYRPTREYFPNLQSFHVEINDPVTRESFPYYYCLLNKSLTSIDIHLAMADPLATCGFLAHVSRHCPSIESIGISGSTSNSLSPALSDLFSSSSSIRSVDIQVPLSDREYQHLAAQPVLFSLSLNCCMTGDINYPNPTRKTACALSTVGGKFPALVELYYRATTWVEAHAILQAMQRPLKTLRISVLNEQPSPSNDTALSTLLTMLPQHPCHTALTSLSLAHTSPSPTSPNAHPLALHPLFELAQLEDLALNIPHSWAIDDAWLAQAATAWRRLKRLSIHPKTSSTLLGLAPLVRRCARLAHVEVSAHWDPFDPRLLLCADPSPSPSPSDPHHIPSPARTSTGKQQAHKDSSSSAVMHILGAGVTLGENVFGVFLCLVMMFPRVRWFGRRYEDDGHAHGQYVADNSLLPPLDGGDADERRLQRARRRQLQRLIDRGVVE